MGKKVIVIGAGISGLTIASNLQAEGFDVEIYEKNNEAGGLCSGYVVNGYYIDACIHWLLGIKNDTSLNRMWRANGALNDDTDIYIPKTLGTFHYKGVDVSFYSDLDKTKEEWIKISPKDEKEINKFFRSIRFMETVLDFSEKDNVSFMENLGMVTKVLKSSPYLISRGLISREKYAKKFKSDAIAFAIKNVQNGYNNLLFFMYEYANFSMDNLGVPIGGAYHMVKRMTDNFISLGGKIHLNYDVKSIITEDDKALGITTNDEEILADIIVSALDPYYTYKHLLNNKYKNKQFKKALKKENKHPVVSCFNVYFSTSADISLLDIPEGLNIEPFKVGSKDTNVLIIRPYYFDNHFTKDGKNIISVLIDQNSADFKYWDKLHNESITNYKNEEKLIINTIIERITSYYGNLKNNLEVITWFGPKDLERRTNTTYGALQSFSFGKSLFISNRKKIKIKNLYLSSQWNKSVGGMPMAGFNAKSEAKDIISKYKEEDK